MSILTSINPFGPELTSCMVQGLPSNANRNSAAPRISCFYRTNAHYELKETHNLST
jgi:hypothetical protein